MELKPSNRDILEKLRHGSARFELVPLQKSDSSSSTFLGSTQRKSHLFFARGIRVISNGVPSQQPLVDRVNVDKGSTLDRSTSLGETKVKQYPVTRVAKDNRSLFRALAKGISLNSDFTLDPDTLQKDVKDVICNNLNEKEKYHEAVAAITLKEPLNEYYCQRFGGDFLRGNSELVVLSKLYEQPIKVYIYEHEHASSVLPIAEYGSEFRGKRMLSKGIKGKKNVVRLLYSVEKNHYYLLC